jgi:hypothetical protein
MSYQYQPVGAANPQVPQPVLYAPAPTTAAPTPQYYGTVDVPISGPSGVQQRFEPVASYRDPAFIVLFVLHLIGLGVIFALTLTRPNLDPNQRLISDLDDNELWPVIKTIAVLVASGIGMSVIWLNLMNSFPFTMIYVGLVGNLVLFTMAGIYSLIHNNIWGGVICLIFVLWWVFFWVSVRARIPFAAEVLRTVTTVAKMYPGTQFAAYLSLLVIIVWQGFWSYTAMKSQFVFDKNTYSGLIVFFLFSFYWVAQVIKNTVHVTISGLFATWYFMSGTVGVPPNPTASSFKRAITTSFGSICLGSMIVAAIQTLRALVRSLRGRNNILAAIADCILGCIDGLVQYFNHYAFIQVAIYGKTFCAAAKSTWSLIQDAGIEAIINDNLVGGVLTSGCFIGAIATGIVGAVVGGIFVGGESGWILGVSLGVIIGFVMLILAMQVIDSGVSTIFVCFAEDREALRRNQPELYERFRVTYNLY